MHRRSPLPAARRSAIAPWTWRPRAHGPNRSIDRAGDTQSLGETIRLAQLLAIDLPNVVDLAEGPHGWPLVRANRFA